MYYNQAEMQTMLARMGRNLKQSVGMDMPAINPTDVSVHDLVAILDRMLIGAVVPGGVEKKPAPTQPTGTIGRSTHQGG